MKMVYVGTLYRYGYDLTVVDDSPEKVEKALMDEYEKHFEDGDPKEEIAYDRYSDLTYYEEARQSIEISEFKFGKVEWR